MEQNMLTSSALTAATEKVCIICLASNQKLLHFHIHKSQLTNVMYQSTHYYSKKICLEYSRINKFTLETDSWSIMYVVYDCMY